MFLYPIVRDLFEVMRRHGKYIDAVDFEDYLHHTMQRYIDESSQPDDAVPMEFRFKESYCNARRVA